MGPISSYLITLSLRIQKLNINKLNLTNTPSSQNRILIINWSFILSEIMLVYYSNNILLHVGPVHRVETLIKLQLALFL